MTDPPGDATPNEDDAVVDQPWTAWPVCPGCSRRRQALCRDCGRAGDDFPLAEELAQTPLVSLESLAAGPAEPDDSIDQVLLRCPVCDEAFPPRFYAVCAWCGHDFGDGWRPAVVEPIEFPRRALYTIFALVGLLVATLAYFAWVLN